MENRKPVDAQASALMLILCVIWALQQIAVKAAAPDMAPILQISLRSGMAALLVGALMLFRRETLPLRNGTWRPGLLVGVLFTLEFLLVGEGLRYTTASHTVVFLYTAPIFTALALHWKFPSERLKPIQWVGIALAFVGIVTTFYGRNPQANVATSPNMLLGDLLCMLAGLSWATTTVVVRTSNLSSLSATQTLLYQLLGAFVLLMIAALALGQTAFRLTPLAIQSLAFQTLIVSFASFLVWFWLLRKYLASRLGVLSFMTPLFGIVLGVWLLHEPLETKFLIGAALVLSGVVLVSRTEKTA